MASDLSSALLQTIQSAAQPTAQALQMENMVVLNEGSLGGFPWYWQSGTNFNAQTCNWINNVFAYNATGQYLENKRRKLHDGLLQRVDGYQLRA